MHTALPRSGKRPSTADPFFGFQRSAVAESKARAAALTAARRAASLAAPAQREKAVADAAAAAAAVIFLGSALQ